LSDTETTVKDDGDLTFDGTTLTTQTLAINTSGQTTTISTYKGANSDGNNIWIGGGGLSSLGAVGATFQGSNNFSAGQDALSANTLGYVNIAVGGKSLRYNTAGYGNTAIGSYSLYSNNNSCVNCAIGNYTLWKHNGSLGTGGNVAIGSNAGYNVTSGVGNTILGTNALYSASLASGCVVIGNGAGYYETGSNKLFIDNTYNRTNEATARTLAMVYGTFAAAAEDQDFVVNAQTGIHITPTAWLTLPAGAAAAGRAPLKLTSGTSLTAAEVGAIEFTTDDLYFTITTGAARKGVVLNNGTNLTSGCIPIATTNGRLTDGPTPASLLPAAAAFFTPSNPAGTTSASYVMMGLGSTIAVTPTKSGKVRLVVSGKIGSGDLSDEVTLKIAWGTGSVPANGAAATGTVVGLEYTCGAAYNPSSMRPFFVKNLIISGLSAGTAHWFDVQMKRISGAGTPTISDIEASVEELVN
jgi:hypothetical protein